MVVGGAGCKGLQCYYNLQLVIVLVGALALYKEVHVVCRAALACAFMVFGGKRGSNRSQKGVKW